VLHEKVYDVAWSGDRKPDEDGKVPPVGNTVDVARATYTNTLGAAELIAVWKDPDFDPNERAFYYGRMLEIPTPRWTAHDAKYYGTRLPPEVPTTTTERAYTSPVWYTPLTANTVATRPAHCAGESSHRAGASRRPARRGTA
jgi:hypothetical protein